MSKSEEMLQVAETLAQLSTRLIYWAEFSLSFRVGELVEEVTLLAGGLRVEGESGDDVIVEDVVEA